MLRPQGSRIELTNRDLDWHHQRAARRIQRNAFNASARFRAEEDWRRRRHPTSSGESGETFARVSADAIPFPTEPVRRVNPQRREEALTQSHHNNSSDDFSPRLPLPVARSSANESTETPGTSSIEWETDEEEVDVPSSVDPNVRAADELEVGQARAASRSHFDGALDSRRQSQQSISQPSAHPSPFVPSNFPTSGPLSFPLPLRLRNISDTAPTFGSPLRFAEAARSSSPERHPHLADIDGPGLVQEAHDFQEVRQAIARQPYLPARVPLDSDQAFDLAANAEIYTSPVRQQLEGFSPASDADIQRLQSSIYDSQYHLPQSLHLMEQQSPGGGPDVVGTAWVAELAVRSSRENSHSNSHLPPSCGEEVTRDGSRVQRFSPNTDHPPAVHHSQSPRQHTPRSMVVYNDAQPASLQPQTPVGLPRHGIPPMSLDASFTAPTVRRARRVAMPDPWHFVPGSNEAQALYRRPLDADDQPGNVGNYGELERGLPESERVQTDEDRRRRREMLEITPSRAPGFQGRGPGSA